MAKRTAKMVLGENTRTVADGWYTIRKLLAEKRVTIEPKYNEAFQAALKRIGSTLNRESIMESALAHEVGIGDILKSFGVNLASNDNGNVTE